MPLQRSAASSAGSRRCSGSSRGRSTPRTVRQWRSPLRNEDRSLSAERRYGPRRLTSLFANDVAISADQGNVWIQGLTSDSRNVARGTRFAALPGAKADGAKFIPQALEAGAAAVLTDERPLEAEIPVPVIRVADPRRALS